MAFCSKCGAKLEDGTKFCDTCGAEQEVQEAAQAPVAEEPKAAAPKADKNKLVGLIAFAAVALVAIIVVVALVSAIFGGGYKKPLKAISKAINKQTTDVNDYLDVLPKFAGTAYEDAMDLVKSIDKDAVKDIEEGIEEGLKDFYDGLEDTYGKKVKLSYEIADKEKLDKDDCEDIADYYNSVVESIEDVIGIDITDSKDLEDIVEKLEDADMLDDVKDKQIDKAIKLITNLGKEFDEVEISKGYVLEVELTLEGKDDEADLDLDVYVVKMNGKWCIEILSTYAEMMGEKPEDMLEELVSELRSLKYYFN